MILDDITTDTKAKVKVLNGISALYINNNTKELTTEKENGKVIEVQQFYAVKSFYKRYATMLNSSCKPCRIQRCNAIKEGFDALLEKLQK